MGKGEGFAELEWGILTEMGNLDANRVMVVTTVHDCQVYDGGASEPWKGLTEAQRGDAERHGSALLGRRGRALLQLGDHVLAQLDVSPARRGELIDAERRSAD